MRCDLSIGLPTDYRLPLTEYLLINYRHTPLITDYQLLSGERKERNNLFLKNSSYICENVRNENIRNE